MALPELCLRNPVFMGGPDKPGHDEHIWEMGLSEPSR